MQTKLFEIRDKATFIPVLCVLVEARSEEERFLLSHSGYVLPTTLVIMTGLAGGGDKSKCDPFDWADRTRQTAHRYIQDHWNTLESGQVIDVEFILGETDKPKVSERLE